MNNKEINSKVLIRVLIFFLVLLAIIWIAMKIYNHLNRPVPPSNMMSQQEKDIYNSKIKAFLDDNEIKGSELKSLLDTIVSMNNNNSVDFVGIKIEKGAIPDYENEEGLLDVCKKASNYNPETGEYEEKRIDIDNKKAYVEIIEREVKTLKTKIKSQNNYGIRAVKSKRPYYEGIYVWIIIEEIK